MIGKTLNDPFQRIVISFFMHVPFIIPRYFFHSYILENVGMIFVIFGQKKHEKERVKDKDL